MRRMIAFGVALGVLAIGGGGTGMFGQQQAQSNDTCSVPRKGAYSIGWVAEESGRHYRCLPIFDRNLRPAGVAWIEVVEDRRFIIKE